MSKIQSGEVIDRVLVVAGLLEVVASPGGQTLLKFLRGLRRGAVDLGHVEELVNKRRPKLLRSKLVL
jgi:hypothetical protein